MFQDRVEQRAQIGRMGSSSDFFATPVSAIGIEHREIELVLGSVQVDEQIVDLVQALPGTRASGRSILLITTIGGSLSFERLRQARSASAAVVPAGIHQQHDAVHHLQGSLHFAAEIAVAGRVRSMLILTPW